MNLPEIQIKRRISFVILGLNCRSVRIARTDPSSATLVSGEDMSLKLQIP